MIKKILILFSLVFLNGCVIAGFDKGLHYQKTPEYTLKYEEYSFYGLSVISTKSNHSFNMMYSTNVCGGYYLIGPIVPFIPIWENKDCSKNVVIGIREADEVKVKFYNKIYNPTEIKDGAYTFPISIKSLSNGAVLIVKKDVEKFEIPFRYQHTFIFDLWPGR